MTVRVIRELSHFEMQVYFATAEILNNYTLYCFAPRMVYGNYASIETFVRKCIQDLIDDAWGVKEERMYLFEANKILLNYLLSVRFFTEFVETKLTRRYGRKSLQVKSFKEALSNCFDSSFAYRFLYKFRNYVQHCGHAVEYISRSTDQKELEKSELYVLCYAKTLLTEYSEWSKVTAELKALNEIELVTLTTEVTAEIRKLDALARPLLFPDAKVAGREMLSTSTLNPKVYSVDQSKRG